MSTYNGWPVATMPTTPAAKFTNWQIVNTTTNFSQPYSGQDMPQPTSARYMRATLTMPKMKAADASAWVAFLVSCRGIIGVFKLSPFMQSLVPVGLAPSGFWRMSSSVNKWTIDVGMIYGFEFDIEEAKGQPVLSLSLANEIGWLTSQSYGLSTPGDAITRTPVSNITSAFAHGTWTVSGHTAAAAVPVATIDGNPNSAYTGNLTGTLSQALSGGQTLIIFSVTDQAYNQASMSDVLTFPTTTTWSIPNVLAGIKLAVVYNSAGAVISTSECYPQWFDLTLRAYSYKVTDQEYYQFPIPILNDGTWRSDLAVDYIGNPTTPQLYGIQANGKWTAKLINQPDTLPTVGSAFVTNANVLATTVYLDGLLRSYEIPSGDPSYSVLADRSYCYDQALAIIASLAYSDTTFTDRLVSGLIHSQSDGTYGTTSTGQWFFSVDAYTASPPDPYYRSGAQAWCIYALCLYLKVRGSSQYGSQVATAISSGITALLVFQETNPAHALYGLVSLGAGSYEGDTFVPDNGNSVVSNASTEHNVDTWFALQAANVLYPGNGYGTAAGLVAAGLSNALWGKQIYGFPAFLEGMATDGTEDTANALDINSWGSLFWLAYGNAANAAVALAACQPFYSALTQAYGYQPYLSAQGYPGAIPNVWPEGTCGVALSTYRQGGGLQGLYTIIQGIAGLRVTDSGWEYCEALDTTYELSTWPGVAGTAWAIVLMTGLRDVMMVSF